MFDAKLTKISDIATHYRLSKNDESLRFSDVVRLWQNDESFATWFSELLANSPMPAFRWETPCVKLDSFSRVFEFVLVDASFFARRRTDHKTFSSFFTSEPVVSFPSLGRDAQMIVPTPMSSKDIYGHLAAFLRDGSDRQRVALWQCVGREVKNAVGENPKWLSTAGGGVAWLHVRIDTRPKYYHYTPYKDVEYAQ